MSIIYEGHNSLPSSSAGPFITAPQHRSSINHKTVDHWISAHCHNNKHEDIAHCILTHMCSCWFTYHRVIVSSDGPWLIACVAKGCTQVSVRIRFFFPNTKPKTCHRPLNKIKNKNVGECPPTALRLPFSISFVCLLQQQQPIKLSAFSCSLSLLSQKLQRVAVVVSLDSHLIFGNYFGITHTQRSVPWYWTVLQLFLLQRCYLAKQNHQIFFFGFVPTLTVDTVFTLNTGRQLNLSISYNFIIETLVRVCVVFVHVYAIAKATNINTARQRYKRKNRTHISHLIR